VTNTHLQKKGNDMTFEEFTQKMKHALQDYFGEELQIDAQNMQKNNGVELTGLIFMDPNNDIAVTVYLEGFYEEYENGKTMGETVRELIRIYEENRPAKTLNMDFFLDYEQVKTRLACRLVNRERNETLLSRAPYQPYLNLAVIACCILMGDEFGCGCIVITQEHIERWKIEKERLFRDARENMPRILRPELMHIEELVEEESRTMLREQMEEKGGQIYILTNTQHFYGAAALLYPGLLEALSGTERRCFFLLPSSVHEVILLADTGQEEAARLGEIVREVNGTKYVSEEEYLSDDVYYYDGRSGMIRLL